MTASAQKVLQLLENFSMADKALRIAYNQIDKNRSGTITPDEFILVIDQFANLTGIPKPPDFIIKQSMKLFDTNRDGAISYEEFKVFVYEILKVEAKNQAKTQGSQQSSQPLDQGGHIPSNVQGLGQGRDAYPGSNQYQQAPYQGTTQPHGQYQGGQTQMQNVQGGQMNEHFPSNTQGLGQGRDAYPGTNQYQGQAPSQGMQGQYQGGQYQTQNVQGGQMNEHFPSNVQGIGQGRDAYQGQYGNHSAY